MDPDPPMGILIQYSKFFYYVYSHCLEEFPFLFPPLEKRDVTGKVEWAGKTAWYRHAQHFTRISGNPDSIAFYPCLSLGMRLR